MALSWAVFAPKIAANFAEELRILTRQINFDQAVIVAHAFVPPAVDDSLLSTIRLLMNEHARLCYDCFSMFAVPRKHGCLTLRTFNILPFHGFG